MKKSDQIEQDFTTFRNEKYASKFHEAGKYSMSQEYEKAIVLYEQAIEYNPPMVYQLIAACHFQIAQKLSAENQDVLHEEIFNLIFLNDLQLSESKNPKVIRILSENEKALFACQRAFKYKTTDKDVLSICYLIAGIVSGALIGMRGLRDFSEAKNYLKSAADLGCDQAINLLRNMQDEGL